MSSQLIFNILLSPLCSFLLSSHAYASRSYPDSIPELLTIKGYAQATTYQIKYLPSTFILDKEKIDSVLADIDRSLSLYRTESSLSIFNNSKASSKADRHLAAIIPEAISIQKRSQGAFDFRLFELSQAWGFGPQPAKHAPSPRKIKRILPDSHDSIWLHDGNLYKSRERLKIDLDGMAQGYSVDILADFIAAAGIKHYMVELGGEIRTSGLRPDGTPWRIGIESPNQQESGNILMVVPGNAAITTSGSYRKSRTFDGKAYSHIIDPKTGRPIDNGMLSCTVIAPTAMLADALDNIGMVLGPAKSIRFFSNFEKVEAYFVWKDQDGNIRTTATEGFLRKIFNQDVHN